MTAKTKDWKVEHDRVREELKCLRKQVEWFENQYRDRDARDAEAGRKLRAALIDILAGDI
jgi:hypothetical protein